jgi:hypothetical protein
MDCREFRDKHLQFVDDTLAGVELVGMQMHVTECEECARQDATVRRSLMLFRNLPRIEPSADFSKRLEMKLREAKLADAASMHSGRTRTLGATVAITSAVMLAYIGVSLRQIDTPQDIVLPPVVALASVADAPNIGAPGPEMIASVPAGLPLWTAALYAEQTSVHFASIEQIATTR